MNVLFTANAWNEFNEIKESSNLGKSLRSTIKEIQRGSNLGKEEKLKYQFGGYMSRRLDKKNRIIYRIENDTIMIISCSGHYLDH